MKITLNNGIQIPQLGLGVFLVQDHQICKDSVLHALHSGYRLIDTAAVYQNERAVGEAIQASGVKRSDIFLTTKIWVQDYGYEKTRLAIDVALVRLHTDYIDLMLLHQPFFDYAGSWRALEEAVRAGKIKSIGLSNFPVSKLQEILDIATIKPAVNQVECHPFLQQKELKRFMKAHDIALEAWYPIGHGAKELLKAPLFGALAQKYQKSVVQVILRWHIQEGHVAIPKSTNPEHIKSNIALEDFQLNEVEMESIRALDRNKGYYNPPEFLQKLLFKIIRVKQD